MKKKFGLIVIFLLFSLFLKINDVYAEVCQFVKETTYAESQLGKETYTITLEGGVLTKAVYQKRDNSGNLKEERITTSSTSFPFTSCSTVESYTFEGSKYNNISYVAPRPSNSNSNSNSNSSGNGSSNPSTTTPEWLKNNGKISCGNIGQIPAKAPELVHMFILIAQIAVPILLVIFGMIDFAKGIMSQKEDEIKKGQKTFISRVIMGAVIFFIVALVKLLIGIVVDNSGNRQNIIACIDCFVNNDCQ